MINHYSGTIVTIRKHIVAQDALAGGWIAVRADESARLGIVVARPKVVEPGFLVVVVAAVAQGVDLCQPSGCGDHLAVGVIFIACHGVAVAVHHADHIALQVQNVEIGRGLVVHGVGSAAGIVGKVHGGIAVIVPNQSRAVPGIVVPGAVDSLAGTAAVFIIREVDGIATADCRHKPTSCRPGISPVGAVVVAERIAGSVVGNGYPVKLGQQILPVAVTVGIGMGCSAVGCCEDIAYIVIGVSIGGIPCRFQQLSQTVVGISYSAFPSLGVGKDIAYRVIGITEGDGRHYIAVCNAGNLGGSLGCGDVLVGIGLGIEWHSPPKVGGNGADPAQVVIMILQVCAGSSRHGIQAAVRVVGIAVSVELFPHLPVLAGELIVCIVALLGLEEGAAGNGDHTGDLPSKGVIGIPPE